MLKQQSIVHYLLGGCCASRGLASDSGNCDAAAEKDTAAEQLTSVCYTLCTCTAWEGAHLRGGRAAPLTADHLRRKGCSANKLNRLN